MMDAALWSSLPTDLVKLVVVAKLPFLSLVRMRLVCKSWNSLILSKGFSPPNPNPKSLLLCPRLRYREDKDHLYRSSLIPYDKVKGRWQKVEDKDHLYRPSLIAYDTVEGVWQKFSVNCFYDILNEDIRLPRLAATGGGLLCWEFTDHNFVVCNPVTSKWKKLPLMELHPRLPGGKSVWWGVAGLDYNENHKSYKLVVVGFCHEVHNGAQDWYLKGTQVYNSVTESWTLTFQDRDPKITRGSDTFWNGFKNGFHKSLFWNNHFYVVTSRYFGWEPEVAVFSMKKGTWIVILAHHSILACSPAYLTCLEETVVLVTEGSEEREITFKSVDFWKLNIPDMEAMWSPNRPNTDNLWLKLKSIKRDQLPGCSGIPMQPLYNWACVGHRKFPSLLLCMDTYGPSFHTSLGDDLHKDSWRRVPSDFLEREGFWNICTFEPSFASV